MRALIAPIVGLAASIGLAILALVGPVDGFEGPLLTGAVAGGITCIGLLGLGLVATGRGGPRSDSTSEDLDGRLARIEEHVMLSDTAKRLLYRDRELDLLRMMVEQDIAAGDHESALRLVDELSEHFGRLEEAEAHRTRIGSLRRAEVESRIEEEMRSIRRLLEAGDWTGATRAAERFQRVLPDAPGAEDLVRQVAAARRRHSIELESRMRDAHADGRIDEAMTLLRDLDRHLEGEEAGRMVDVAHAIIVAHRDLLGTRFRAAVGERRWTDAVELGETIARDYPNTRMAEEVGELMRGLRQKVESERDPRSTS